MPIRSLLLCFIIIFLLPFQAVAVELKTVPASCLKLGSKPSLIVKFKKGSSKVSLASSYATFTTSRPMSGGADVVYFSPHSSLKSQELSPGCYAKSAIDALVQEIKSRGNVEYVDPNLLMSISEVKPRLTIPVINPLQWDMLTPPAEPGGMDVQNAFSISMGHPSVITAVLDTGILNNNDLNPNVLPGVTFSNTHYGVGATPSCDSTCSGYDHGTHVAGTVASSGLFVYGVAPLTKILPVNVATKFTTTSDCSPDPVPCLKVQTVDLNNALNWLAGDTFAGLPPADAILVLNLSITSQGVCGTARQTAINRLIAKNVSIAVAAGNNNVDVASTTPANCNNVMAVAATNRSAYGASYSNYGTLIRFAAPGGNTPLFFDGILSTIENSYDYRIGTDTAAPHAAGLAALMNSIDPTLTPTTVLSLMQTTARAFPIGGPGDSCTIGRPCGTGILDAYNAMQTTLAQRPVITWPPLPISVVMNSATQVTVSWKAAFWNPSRPNTILYTANLDGSDVPACSLTTTRVCVFSGLVPDSIHTVKIKAVDTKQILTPVETADEIFQLLLVPPTLTSAVRDPLKYRTVYIYYSNLGSPLPPDSYQLNGAPLGVTLTLDTANSRFILDNVVTLDAINNVSISSIYDSVIKTSNTVTIPGVSPVAPVLTIADRNPLLLTQVFVYYSSLGGPPPDAYSVQNVPPGATVSIDASHQRFVLDNITNPKKIDFVYLTSTYGAVIFESNYVTIPSIL